MPVMVYTLLNSYYFVSPSEECNPEKQVLFMKFRTIVSHLHWLSGSCHIFLDSALVSLQYLWE